LTPYYSIGQSSSDCVSKLSQRARIFNSKAPITIAALTNNRNEKTVDPFSNKFDSFSQILMCFHCLHPNNPQLNSRRYI
jgi:hypothetical protein